MPLQLMVLLVSVLPIIEMKGGIPFGVSQGLPVIEATAIGIIGTCLQIPFNLLLIFWLTKLGDRYSATHRFLEWSRDRSRKHQDLVNRWGTIGVAILVGIPIPGTGLWTGTMAGSLIGLNYRLISMGLVLGTIIAGILVGLTTAGITRLF